MWRTDRAVCNTLLSSRREIWELDAFCLSNLREIPKSYDTREHIAGRVGHPGKGRDTMDSHFVGMGEERGA